MTAVKFTKRCMDCGKKIKEGALCAKCNPESLESKGRDNYIWKGQFGGSGQTEDDRDRASMKRGKYGERYRKMSGGGR